MLRDETVITFAEAARSLPPLNGRHVHTSTLWRWARRGCRGVKLEVRRLGGRFVTSIEALDRFGEALAAIDLPQRAEPPSKSPTDRQREKSIEQAEKVLSAGGML